MSAIGGLIIIVGCITLYKTFALYEEKKEFNVLRGRVPNFSSGDIKLAFSINGEYQNGVPFPNKEDGYGVSNVICKNGVTAEWNNILWGLMNIKNTTNSKIECTIDFASEVLLSNVVELGDYIAYTPSLKNYTLSASVTGYTTNQVIKPNELNLWRVIKINEDGTIEIVSEYTSSNYIYFSGKVGYDKLIESLNAAASAYETEGLTVNSRHIGYSGQTKTVNISTSSSEPWSTTTSSSNSPNGSTRERAGGGDYGFVINTNLLSTALGTLKAKIKATTASSYWLASRHYETASSLWVYCGRYIEINGDIKNE